MSTSVTHPLTRRGLPTDPVLRIMALGSFANRFGSGAVMTTSALYFTRKLGFAATDVGFALGFAAALGLLVAVPAGHLGDIRGPRELLRIFLGAGAFCALLPVFARQPWHLALFLGLYTMCERSAGSVNQGIIAQVAGGRAVLFKAYLRAVTNTALGLGSLVGGLALIVDEPWAYVSVFVIDAAFTACAAWNVGRLPHLAPTPVVAGEPRLAVMRDWPFVVMTLLTGVFGLHFIAMELGLALYISERTKAPTVMVAVLLAINTACVALFQVRLSRSAESVAAAARALVKGSLWISAGFVVIALADRGSVVFAVAMLVSGSVLHVVGEMLGSGGQWGIQMGLAPRERQGQYQGFAGTGFSIVAIIGPPVVTFLCVDHGEVGWLILAGIIVGAALACVPLSRWALRSRERYGVRTHTG